MQSLAGQVGSLVGSVEGLNLEPKAKLAAIREGGILLEKWYKLARVEIEAGTGSHMSSAGNKLACKIVSAKEWIQGGSKAQVNKALEGKWVLRQVQGLIRGVGDICQIRAAIKGKMDGSVLSPQLCILLADWPGEGGDTPEFGTKLANLVHYEMDSWKNVARTQVTRIVQEALDKGTSTAFRMVKKQGKTGMKEGGGLAGRISLAVQDQLAGQTALWAGLWATGEHPSDPWLAGPLGWADFLGSPIEPEVFFGAAKSFKGSTSTVGGWHPRHFGMLDSRLIEILMQLVWVYEIIGVWPMQEEEVLAQMLAKATGGHRPIMLFRTLFRVVGKARACPVKNWMETMTRQYHEINMAPRRSVSDATFRLQVRRDLGIKADGSDLGHTGEVGAEVQWDLSKVFDRVVWGNLVERAIQFGYPLDALRLSMVPPPPVHFTNRLNLLDLRLPDLNRPRKTGSLLAVFLFHQ